MMKCITLALFLLLGSAVVSADSYAQAQFEVTSSLFMGECGPRRHVLHRDSSLRVELPSYNFTVTSFDGTRKRCRAILQLRGSLAHLARHDEGVWHLKRRKIPRMFHLLSSS